ncbi:Hypothetical_protein [Hexamita inflata]|uniref:Hypothetical_protein n=1 Tax=Hexamita inflata TaxID=28002 RepID=A0AA86PQR2_9EUKA|nr:Hypothetical protein HINF_LOCUS31581 [Hexamita inflata]
MKNHLRQIMENSQVAYLFVNKLNFVPFHSGVHFYHITSSSSLQNFLQNGNQRETITQSKIQMVVPILNKDAKISQLQLMLVQLNQQKEKISARTKMNRVDIRWKITCYLCHLVNQLTLHQIIRKSSK